MSSYVGSGPLNALMSMGVAARQLLFVDPDKLEAEEDHYHFGSFRSYHHRFGTQSEASDGRPPPLDALAILTPFVMTESNTFRKLWECSLMFLLLYIGLVFPYRLAFVEFRLHPPGDCDTDEESEDMVRFELFVTVFFWVDLLLGFLLTYRTHDDIEVTAPSQIVRHYLRTFFFVNLLACLPSSAFAPLIVALDINPGGCVYESSANSAARLARLQRVTRLARLARVLRIVKIVSFVQKNAVAEVVKVLRSLRLLNWIVSLGWVVHLLACGWYLVAALHEDHTDTWVGRRAVSADGTVTLLSQEASIQWANSMYFILTVFTTVGFGDMSAVTIGEIVYVVFVMMVGAIVHSIIISEMINLISEVDEDTKWRRTQVSLLEAYSSHAGLDTVTRDRLTGWVNTMPSGRSSFDPEEMRRLLTSGRMPRKLLGEMPDRLFGGQLQRNKLMRACAQSCLGGAMPPRFSLLLSTVLNIRSFKAKDVVFELHDHAFNLFLVMSGTFAYVGEATEAGGFDVQMDRSFNSLDRGPKMAKPASVFDYTVPVGADYARDGIAVSYYHTMDGETVAVVNPPESSRSYSFGHNRGPRNSVLGQTRGAWSPDRPNGAAEQWTPETSKAKEWMQINMGTVKNVSGVSVQGHPDPLRDEWATRVKVYVSHSGINDMREWEEVRLRPNNLVLNGSRDRDTKVEFLFGEARMAQFVRIEPVEWHGERPSLRAAVLVLQQRLYPYQLLGRGDYFGEDVLLEGNRTATVRCEAETRTGPASVMLLHKQDLTENGVGAKLLEEFPQFRRVLRSECLRLQARRREMLARLCRGRKYDAFAAYTLQVAWRQRLERRAPEAEPPSLVERSPSSLPSISTSFAGRGDRFLRTAASGEGELSAKVERLASELSGFRSDVAMKLQTISSALEKLAVQGDGGVASI
jgi:CRP-like cAMP-binding protein